MDCQIHLTDYCSTTENELFPKMYFLLHGLKDAKKWVAATNKISYALLTQNMAFYQFIHLVNLQKEMIH